MMRWVCSGTLLFIATVVGCTPVVRVETTGGSSSNSAGGSTNSGSSSSGGAGGTGGIGGSGGSGGTVVSPPPECTVDSNCTLINDCCTCLGVSENESIPECPMMECFAPTCNAIGLATPTAICRAGQCVVDADCNHDHALCNSPPPVCPPGKTPHVVDNCWGGCIDVTECREVGSCAQCGDGQACVTSNMMMQSGQHCVDVPDACMGQISCECMGKMLCGFAEACYEVSATELKCIDITTK